jgi:8-oxo-dGTP pyrophosphatase MutT (NUDIX family)
MQKYDIFISHTATESALAEEFQRRIDHDFADFDIFISSDDTSITSDPAGWMKQIHSAIITSKYMLVLCSQDSVKRPWLAFEAGAAWVRIEKNSDGEDVALCHITPVCHGGLTENQLPNPYNVFQVANIDSRGISRIYINICKIFNKRPRSQEQIENTVTALKVIEKKVSRNKIIIKQLANADSAGAICYKQKFDSRELLILIVRTRDKDRWIFPKGSFNSGVDHFACIDEELLSEAGIFADVQKDFPLFVEYHKGNGTLKHLVLYPAKHSSSVIAKERELRGEPIWVNAKDVKKYLTEGRENTSTLKSLALAFDAFLENLK